MKAKSKARSLLQHFYDYAKTHSLHLLLEKIKVNGLICPLSMRLRAFCIKLHASNHRTKQLS